MNVGDTFTHQGIEYTATSVEDDTVKGIHNKVVTEVHGDDDHSKTRPRRICIKIADIVA